MDAGTGKFHGTQTAASAQALVSTSTSAYTFLPQQNLPSSPYSNGILQVALYNLFGPTFPSISVTTTGDNTSNYDAAAQAMAFNFLPYSQTSTVLINYSFSFENSNTFGYANLYIYPSLLPGPFASTGDADSVVGETIGKAKAFLELSVIDFLDNFPFAICLFKTGAGTCFAGQPTDFVCITEVANTAPLPVQHATASITGTTPGAITTFDISGLGQSASMYIQGTVLFSDTLNVLSSTQDFMFFINYNGPSNVTTCTVGPSNNTSVAPYLTYGVSSNVVTVYGVGVTGSTFNISFNYTIVQGGL